MASSRIKEGQPVHSEVSTPPVYASLFASRTTHMGESAIREILKFAQKPDIISFAGGLPAPECMPTDLIPELHEKVVESFGDVSQQYAPTEGLYALREAAAAYLPSLGVTPPSEDIHITSGSQGALDALGKIFINPGDVIITEQPTYLGALQALNAYGATYRCVVSDKEGVIPESLAEALAPGDAKFIYLVPTFQNPTGSTISWERRQRIAEIIARSGALLVEDDPYNKIRFEGDAVPPIWSLIPDNVVYLTSMSKILSPAMRVGFVVAPPDIARWMVLAKQGTDLCSSAYTQALAAVYLTGGYLDTQLPHIIETYRPRRDAMIGAFDAYFPHDWTRSNPDGGMFVFVEGPMGTNTGAILPDALSRHVAFVPGAPFFPNGGGESTMRLNFSNSPVEKIDAGMNQLGQLIWERRSHVA